MADADRELTDVTLLHLTEIASGRCSITEPEILAETNPKIQQILAGLLILHEDLEFRRGQWERSNEDLRSKTEELEAVVRELQSAQEGLLQSSKMAAVGQLAAGIAHEINNPLGIILGFAQGMEKRVPEGDALRLPVASIAREALRCKQLVQELLIFARTGKKSTEDLDVLPILEASSVLLESQAGTQEVDFIRDFREPIPPIHGNRTQLQQVLVNLGVNALDATPAGGQVILRARRDEANGVCVEMCDTGSGIPLELRSRIFEPFFTTKDPGKGTGLGLSLVFEIIQQHGGTIRVEDGMEGGTQMIMRFPAAADRQEGRKS